MNRELIRMAEPGDAWFTYFWTPAALGMLQQLKLGFASATERV
jgi:hypothetical protein